MTRLARMVVSGLPHHVNQRGNRREAIFFEDGDQEIYRDLLGEQARKAGPFREVLFFSGTDGISPNAKRPVLELPWNGFC